MRRRVRINIPWPTLEEVARTMKVPMKRARELEKLADQLYFESTGRKPVAATEFKRKRRKISTDKAKARLRKALKPPAEGVATPRR